MSKAGAYELPQGLLALDRPVVRPVPGSLPIRGDLAHIALANDYLVAHYVVPQLRSIGPAEAPLMLSQRGDPKVLAALPAGSEIEVLDYAGAWAWACLGPKGPTGYVRIDQLAPEDQ